MSRHVTVHLADSLPVSAIQRIDELIKEIPESEQPTERRRRLQDWMDAGHGSCVLEIEALAKQMEETLLHFDGIRYRTFAWVVMPTISTYCFNRLVTGSYQKSSLPGKNSVPGPFTTG